MKDFFNFLIVSVLGILSMQAHAVEPFCPGGSSPSPNVLWCDSFENPDLVAGAGYSPPNYIDYNDDGGNFARSNLDSYDGNYSLRSHWTAGSTGSGSVMFGFGRNPVNSKHFTTQDFEDIYWRFYVKLANGFIGSPNKLTRAFIFGNSSWGQAIAAHLWDGFPLELDLAIGIDASSTLVTSSFNDPNLVYIGNRPGKTTMSPGTWYCVEAHLKLNTPGASDGVFEYWINDSSEASLTNLNLRYSWQDYGINTIMFSNYWNGTSPADQDRFIDSFVVSKQRIGCAGGIAPPKPPSDLTTY